MIFKRITVNPEIFGGKPCIRGLRFPVSRLLGLLAAGETSESILESYPYLEKEDIQVDVAFDKKFARLYKNTFGIKPVINRRGSFKLPQMGWYILFKDEDELRLKHVVLNSPFAYCLKKPQPVNYPKSDQL